jgi:hypothetical protein
MFIVDDGQKGLPFAADTAERRFDNTVAEEILAVDNRIGVVNVALGIAGFEIGNRRLSWTELPHGSPLPPGIRC